MSSSITWRRTRPPVCGTHGAVASAHPLATQAGFDVLRSGGNAVDAAVATAATLNVVEPYMSGVGGVGFLLLHLANGETKTLNFSGNTPAAARPELFTSATQELGPRACLIPGNVAGWFEALTVHGTKPPQHVFAQAISLAEEGFPLHPFNLKMIGLGRSLLNDVGLTIYGDVPLQLGAILRQPELAKTLSELATRGPEYFYRGELGAKIADYIQSQGGFLSHEDLSKYSPQWQTPIGVDYRGVHVKTCPPNNEGFQILQTLKLLEGSDLATLKHNSTDYIHLLTEAIKLAVADRIEWAGDPDFTAVPLDRLLSDEYISERRQLINLGRASLSEGERWRGNRKSGVIAPGIPSGLTTHMAVVDSDGNVASITQSLGSGFGSGVVVPDTGVALNNFVKWTEIDPRCPTPNLLQPGKRWASCMAPVHVFRDDGNFWFSIATPGSEGILQTTLQMLLNVVEFGADPQLAIEAARFRVWEDTRIQIEERVPAEVRAELVERGHSVESLDEFSPLVGGGQSVMVEPQSGARIAGADPRRDGYALAF